MLLIYLVCSLSLAASGQRVEDDWIDPYDMLNYDASTKTMRKPAEPTNYPNVPTKRREYTLDSSQAAQALCNRQIEDLQKQIEDQKKKIKLISQQPTCHPVFKRFLRRLLKEIQRFGLPSDSSDVLYDAKIQLSGQAITEIQTLLEGEDSWRTGALDNAISQILVDLRPHDYEAWRWRFEDTFGVELDTVLKMGLCVLIMVAIICTQLWSTVSWFVQFRRLFAICFFVSIVWNWFYLYKIAFAEHQNNIVKMDSVNEKCTGVKRIDWSDSLKEWFRSTWTLQDDPCKRYYEVLMVNPILLVPPTKAISLTITTFITEPLKHLGQGISEFLRALLKDLPITLQIPVLLTIVLSIVVFLYGSVQAAFQHCISVPFRRPKRDPPPAQLQQPQHRHQGIEDYDYDRLAEGDAPQHPPRRQAYDGRNLVHQRRPNRSREEPTRRVVDTVGTAEPLFSEDEMDSRLRETEQNLSAGVHQRQPDRSREEPTKRDAKSLGNAKPPHSMDEPDSQLREAEQNLSAESDLGNRQRKQTELTGASASSVAANTAQLETKPTESDLSHLKTKPQKENDNLSKDELTRVNAESKSQQAKRLPSQNDVEDLHALAEDATSSISLTRVPVQESSPVLAE